jgi:hypothetical protein
VPNGASRRQRPDPLLPPETDHQRKQRCALRLCNVRLARAWWRCVEEWGFKNGEKRVRIGQEMDGETNMVEGKIETWTEQWCKTLEADGRLARTTAEKVSLRPQCAHGVRRRSRLNE